MKVKVDPKKCDGNGLCTRICPDIFELKSKPVHIKVKEVPNNLEDKCKEAVKKCPKKALSTLD